VFGGIGTLAVVAIWWRFFPILRDVDRFDEVRKSGLDAAAEMGIGGD
jgi:hypothetical protein